MGEGLKPDYHLSMKRYWFAKIWNGEKDIEYRKVSPKYKAFAAWVDSCRPRFVMLYIGMQPNGPRLLVQVTKTEIGPCPIEGFDGPHYILHFHIIQPYLFDRGTYYPMADMPRMKEKPTKKKHTKQKEGNA